MRLHLTGTRAKIGHYRDEAIEIHTHLQSASPFLALRLAEKIQNYPPKAQSLKSKA